jgi:hypothetical protein
MRAVLFPFALLSIIFLLSFVVNASPSASTSTSLPHVPTFVRSDVADLKGIADIGALTVSGLSAGGFFAVQFHVAFSAIVKGAGVWAGGPYWCAAANVGAALSVCMSHPALLLVDPLVAATVYAESLMSIDQTGNMKTSKVYIFSGSEDTVVDPGVVRKLETYYEHYVDPTLIKSRYDVPAEHSLVLDNYGNACNFLGEPFINNCGVDTVHEMLDHVVGPMANAPVSYVPQNLIEFAQGTFVPPIFISPSVISLGPNGYIYVPKTCQSGAKKCPLHVHFHGCEQDVASVGMTYVEQSRFIEYAEANDFVVLFPQAERTMANPNGCFDWWGYSGVDYATKLGAQMATVFNMVAHFAN